jgi:hypothetical protein
LLPYGFSLSVAAGESESSLLPGIFPQYAKSLFFALNYIRELKFLPVAGQRGAQFPIQKSR